MPRPLKLSLVMPRLLLLPPLRSYLLRTPNWRLKYDFHIFVNPLGQVLEGQECPSLGWDGERPYHRQTWCLKVCSCCVSIHPLVSVNTPFVSSARACWPSAITWSLLWNMFLRRKSLVRVPTKYADNRGYLRLLAFCSFISRIVNDRQGIDQGSWYRGYCQGMSVCWVYSWFSTVRKEMLSIPTFMKPCLTFLTRKAWQRILLVRYIPKILFFML